MKVALFTVPTSSAQGFQFLHILDNTIFLFSKISPFNGFEMLFHWFICIYLII